MESVIGLTTVTSIQTGVGVEHLPDQQQARTADVMDDRADPSPARKFSDQQNPLLCFRVRPK